MIHIGVDEVGRGCWAGPLVAAAVALNPLRPIKGLNDSKKLSRSKREKLVVLIREQALYIGIGWVWPHAIDASGVTTAVKTAMEQAVQNMFCQVQAIGQETSDYYIIVDGNYNYLGNLGDKNQAKVSTMVGADGLVEEVSAASIIAKVARDDYMTQHIAKRYPQYGFEKHVGYGTALHRAMLVTYGVTPIHRMSYKPIKVIMTRSRTGLVANQYSVI